MRIGLIGLPNSGKTTIFNALTGSEAEVTPYGGSRGEPNVAVVQVIDPRVTRLSEIYRPKKTAYAAVEFIDFRGVDEGSAGEGLFSASSMGLIKNADALALVVRNFQDPLAGDPSPMKDIGEINGELLLSDLMIAETRLERIERGYKRGQKTDALLREERVLRRILEHLNADQPIRTLALEEDSERMIRGFQFLTGKPALVILNSDERRFGDNRAVLEEIGKGQRAIEFAGQFEMELARLDEEEAALFMEDMGIAASARDRLTRLAYEILGYISFFTVGSDEVRAWTLHMGQSALEAAGSIHTDLARGFIRAECFSYNDLMEWGTEKAIRENGRFRLEGKNYVVEDGNILNIRFNV